jgi:hypothetical protein
MKRNIALVRNFYSKPLITFKSHDLHAGDIRGVAGLRVRQLPTMRGTSSLPSLVPMGYAFDGPSLTFLFVFHVTVLTINF